MFDMYNLFISDEGMPLPEDVDLQCFLPLQGAHRYQVNFFYPYF